ncbi:MAG: membrane dipeptidase [Clostridia bacterium]|nr:membrane dipeptidase [Clostridia bacterium]
MRLFDLHCDTLYELYQNKLSLHQNNLHVDLQKGNRFSPWCQVFAVWIPEDKRGEEAVAFFSNVVAYACQQFSFIKTKPEAKRAIDEGKCAGILAVEGGSVLGGNIENIARLSNFGVKIVTLTWNGSNELGNGCLSKDTGGLTSFGKEVVRKLYQHRIMPDVSHLNESGFWDVAELSDKPFIATHSVSADIHVHPRNLNRCQFAEIRDRGGVVGINFCADQLGRLDFETVYRHLAHFCDLGGENTVALGTDFDGTTLPPPWNNMAVLEALAEHLCKKGFSETMLDKFFFENAWNFFEKHLL